MAFCFLLTNTDSRIPNFVEKVMHLNQRRNDCKFVQLLVEPKMRLVSALLSGTLLDMDDICESLVTVFESCGKIMQLLQWAIDIEVKSTSDFFLADFH